MAFSSIVKVSESILSLEVIQLTTVNTSDCVTVRCLSMLAQTHVNRLSASIHKYSRQRIHVKRTFPHVLFNLFRIVSINWNVYSSFRCCLCGRSARRRGSSSKILLARTCVGASFVLSPRASCSTLATRTLCTKLLALLLP